ncbi:MULTISPECIES: sigma factor-like helix-turn-helix DNA-binding protein [unclassified Micromonospora]|uniref:sigma factor-like helix-turn-helix DNA-binding protein n=1 Tax=unclassified Micromonospora TaxID=2617518 RepID=UPI0020B1C459|nr:MULTISPECIES: sigma factor-like helix-turn-helix DNA-binding protein [unclassified Micromonospora]MDM4780919.1 sigma factor-like helix-turn-helix DNA-binding protein [Micromonospora sp. b486]
MRADRRRRLPWTTTTSLPAYAPATGTRTTPWSPRTPRPRTGRGAARRRPGRRAVTADDGLDTVLAAERRAALVGALRRLPVRDREVIVCRYLLDLGEDETVTVLGLPRGTVKSRTHRALAKLRALLDREEALRG